MPSFIIPGNILTHTQRYNGEKPNMFAGNITGVSLNLVSWKYICQDTASLSWGGGYFFLNHILIRWCGRGALMATGHNPVGYIGLGVTVARFFSVDGFPEFERCYIFNSICAWMCLSGYIYFSNWTLVNNPVPQPHFSHWDPSSKDKYYKAKVIKQKS